MCGLAAQRRKRGLPSAAVNIGAIIGAGYMGRQSRKELDKIVERYQMMRMSEEDWCQSISEAIDACRFGSPHGPELIAGLSEVSLDSSNTPNAPNWCFNPKFSPLIVTRNAVVDEEKKGDSLTTSKQLGQCQSEEEVYQVIERKLQVAISTPLNAARLVKC
jgi:hypothetical protein